MARIYICDRCGQQLTPQNQGNYLEEKYNIKIRVMDENGDQNYERYLNLCNECRKEVESTLDEMLMDCPEKVVVSLERDI